MSEIPVEAKPTPSVSIPTRSGRVFDLAVFLTLATGISYVLAWTYWHSYFVAFGLSSDFVEIRVETVIGAVWPLSVIYLLFGISLFGEDDHIRTMRSGRVSCLALFVFAWVLVLPLFLGEIEADTRAVVGTVLWIVLLVIAIFTIRKQWSPLRRDVRLDKPEDFVVPLVILAVIITFGFHIAGARDADKLATGQRKERVRVETHGVVSLPAELALVAITRDRVVLVAPHKPNPHPEAIVLSASDIAKLTTYEAP